MTENIAKEKTGRLYIISAPSGAGKSTLCTMMRNKYNNIEYSVSYTTREPRQNEVNGKDYYFVSVDKFKEMISKDLFLEWAEVHGNYYGTSREIIDLALENGIDIFLDIDPQGAMQLKEKLNGKAVFIFLTAPSIDELRNRLNKRGTEASHIIDKRISNAMKEITYFNNYDYVIINDNSAQAFIELEAVYIAEKVRANRFNKPEDFIKL